VRTRDALIEELERLRRRVSEIEDELHERGDEPAEGGTLDRFEEVLRQVSRAGVVRIDATGNCVGVNDRWCEITGLSREEALGRGWLRVLAADDRERSLRDWSGLITDAVPELVAGRLYRAEWHYRRPDGRTLWIQSDTIGETDPEGRPTGVLIGIIVDITARKGAEAAAHDFTRRLQRQLQELETLYRNAPVGLCLLDRDLRIVRINERLAAVTGSGVQELVGVTVERAVPSLADQIVPAYRQIFETGEPGRNREVRGRPAFDPSVEHTWLLDHHPLKDSDGTVAAVISVVQDITSIKRATDELGHTKEHLAKAQRLAGIGSWEWDLLEDRLWWSEELFRMFGRDSATFQPSFDAFIEHVHPDDRSMIRKQLDATFSHDEPYAVEFRALLTTGAVRTIQTSAELERTPEGTPARLIGTAQDITELRTAERALAADRG
jgi:PAS domain S-box-containing protein